MSMKSDCNPAWATGCCCKNKHLFESSAMKIPEQLIK